MPTEHPQPHQPILGNLPHPPPCWPSWSYTPHHWFWFSSGALPAADADSYHLSLSPSSVRAGWPLHCLASGLHAWQEEGKKQKGRNQNQTPVKPVLFKKGKPCLVPSTGSSLARTWSLSQPGKLWVWRGELLTGPSVILNKMRDL